MAEIVGTLMLVVIVVAAATAFAFFVAAYQKQLLAQETINHDRTLESLKVIGISEVTCAKATYGCDDHQATCKEGAACFAEVDFTVASLDVNPIGVASLYLDHHLVVNYSATIGQSVRTPCFNSSDVNNNLTHGLLVCQNLVIPSYSTIVLHLNLGGCLNAKCNNSGYWALGPGEGPGQPYFYNSSESFELTVETVLGNEFTDSLVPPVAIVSVFYVSSGNISIPVFDGLSSYQPKAADNASIESYNWSFSPSPPHPHECGDGGIDAGAELECAGLASDTTYAVTLTVTNSDGLTGVATIEYTPPP